MYSNLNKTFAVNDQPFHSHDMRCGEILKRTFKMTNIMAEAVEAIEKKLDGSVFDGSAKFAIQDEGSIIIDSSGVRVSDDETEVTLSASLETFQEILEGDLDSASAFMTGRLQLDGDMSVAMRLASVLS